MFGYDFRVDGLIESVKAGQLNDGANILALIRLLIDKGICTEQEWADARLRAIGEVDQIYAAVVAKNRSEVAVVAIRFLATML
jgi:hypothetical protein